MENLLFAIPFLMVSIGFGMPSCGLVSDNDDRLEIIVENLEEGFYELNITAESNQKTAEKLISFGIEYDADERVNNISELREVSPENEMRVTVSGYYEADDGGGGMFVFDAQSTENSDNGMIISSDVSDQGRWIREVFENEINVLWYGMQSGLEECQGNRLLSAISYFFDRQMVGTVFIPEGAYRVERELGFWEGVSIKGEGIDLSVIMNHGTGYTRNSMFPAGYHHSDERNLDMEISDITIDVNMYDLDTWIGAIWIEHPIRNLTIERTRITNSGGNIIRLMKSSRIADSVFDNMDGRGLSTGWESRPNLRFRDNEIINNKFIRTASSPTGPGINLSRAENNLFKGNEVININRPGDTYGGIRMPNDSRGNTVEENYVKNFPRGIWILSGGQNNMVIKNTVVDSWIAAMFINSSHERYTPTSGNTFAENVVIQENSEISTTTDLIRIHEDFDATIVDNVIRDNETIITQKYYDDYKSKAESEFQNNGSLEEGLILLTNGAHLESINEVSGNFVTIRDE